jgi:hypothetical protein
MSMLQDSEIDAIPSGGAFGHPPPSKYEKLILLAKEVPPTGHSRRSSLRRDLTARRARGVTVARHEFSLINSALQAAVPS